MKPEEYQALMVVLDESVAAILREIRETREVVEALAAEVRRGNERGVV